jgi:hypothetical protein
MRAAGVASIALCSRPQDHSLILETAASIVRCGKFDSLRSLATGVLVLLFISSEGLWDLSFPLIASTFPTHLIIVGGFIRQICPQITEAIWEI